MNTKEILKAVLICFTTIVFFLALTLSVWAENIDPFYDGFRYAYGENVGWLNFEPGGDGSSYAVTVKNDRLTGYVWAENIGWINLSPLNHGGVFNDGYGNLSGYAWGENVGWINFSPDYGGICIDKCGNFNGWAWGENIGWIHFQSSTPIAYKVQTIWISKFICGGDFDNDGDVDGSDLAIFAADFGRTNCNSDCEGDFDNDGDVDGSDLATFAADFGRTDCPVSE
jgi:hypothetical protein